MSLALLCIVGFQIYWISETYKINQKQLDRDVNRVLTVASERYLGQRAITFFTTLNSEGSSIDKVLVKPYLWNDKDSARINKKTVIREIKSTVSIQSDSLTISANRRLPTTIQFDSGNINISYQTEDGDGYKDVERDSNSSAKSLKGNFSIQTFFKTGDLDTANHLSEMIIREQLEGVKDAKKQLNYLLIPTLEYQQLDSILKDEFGEFSIDIPFEYGVYDNKNQKRLYISDSLLHKNLQESTYKTALVQPFSDGDISLKLILKNSNAAILRKMLIPFLASFLLVGVTIVSLGYSLKTILGQKRLSESKNDFINNMTHEFKTPISTISLALEAIVSFDVQKDASKMAKYLEISRYQTQRLGMMVEKVLKIAISEKTDIKLNLEKVNLHELIAKVKESIEMQVKEKGGEVSIACNAPKAELEIDPVHISNVLYNLIDNASKYSPQKPKIIISTKQTGNYLKIDVSDNGIGIPKHHRKHIFDKFYRVPTGNVHDVKGFGLGLCYVAMIINQHEGKMELQSEVDKGSTFSIMLPYQN